MEDEVAVGLGVVIVLAVIFTMALYLANAGGLDVFEYLQAGIVVVIVLAAVVMLKDRWSSLRAGLPTKDELAEKVTWKAGYYAWIATIWIALGTSWINEIIIKDGLGLPGLLTRHVAPVIIMASALTFFVLYFWFKRKGV